MEGKTFEAGTLARCNRCDKAHPLPCAMRGERVNDRAYRLMGRPVLLDCGHLDAHWVYDRDNPKPMKVTVEEIYKVACWRHNRAQHPWDVAQVQFWHGVAAGLTWALKAKGLNDRQLRHMEDDAIALGPSGRWDGILETLDRPDGTVRHED